MRLCEDFKLDGMPMLVPDEDLEMKMADIDASDAGRDESGVMHRMVVRRRVRTWAFRYAFLTAEEYAYIQSLLEGRDTFTFTFPQTDGTVGSCTAYCSAVGIALRNLRTGRYRNCSFNIIEC